MRRAGIVFLGGGIGSCLRAAVLTWLSPSGPEAAVLLVNILGAFVLGVVWVLADEAGLMRTPARLFLAVGVLGGYTTFSTFGWGADLLFAHRRWLAATAYLLASIGGGYAAVSLGHAAGRVLVGLSERAALMVLQRLSARGMRRFGDAQAETDAATADDREASA